MADRYDDRYRGDEHRGDRYGYGYRRDDRGFVDRAGDEVRSWFGDDEAMRRRRMDEERDGRDRDWDRGRDWGHPMGLDYQRRPGRDWSERGHGYASSERGWPFDTAQGRGSERWGGERWSSGPTPSAGFGPGPGGFGTHTHYGTNNFGTTGYGPAGSASGQHDFGMTSTGMPYPRYSGHGPRGYQRSDDRIREDICDRLTDDPWVDASDIEVTVRGGEVTLTGAVRDRSDKRRAEDILDRISGVREVNNNLKVTKGGLGE